MYTNNKSAHETFKSLYLNHYRLAYISLFLIMILNRKIVLYGQGAESPLSHEPLKATRGDRRMIGHPKSGSAPLLAHFSKGPKGEAGMS